MSECDKLLAMDSPQIKIDLTAVKFISSDYMGAFIDVAAQAKKDGRRLILVIPESLRELFQAASFEKVMDLEIA